MSWHECSEPSAAKEGHKSTERRQHLLTVGRAVIPAAKIGLSCPVVRKEGENSAASGQTETTDVGLSSSRESWEKLPEGKALLLETQGRITAPSHGGGQRTYLSGEQVCLALVRHQLLPGYAFETEDVRPAFCFGLPPCSNTTHSYQAAQEH